MVTVKKHTRRTKKGYTRVKSHKRKVQKRSLWPADTWEQKQQLEGSVRFFRDNPTNEFVLAQLIPSRERNSNNNKVTKRKISREVTKQLSDQDMKYLIKQQDLAVIRSDNLKRLGWEDKQIRDHIGREIRLDPYFRTFRGRRKSIRKEIKKGEKPLW